MTAQNELFNKKEHQIKKRGSMGEAQKVMNCSLVLQSSINRQIIAIGMTMQCKMTKRAGEGIRKQGDKDKDKDKDKDN